LPELLVRQVHLDWLTSLIDWQLW